LSGTKAGCRGANAEKLTKKKKKKKKVSFPWSGPNSDRREKNRKGANNADRGGFPERRREPGRTDHRLKKAHNNGGRLVTVIKEFAFPQRGGCESSGRGGKINVGKKFAAPGRGATFRNL